MREAEEVEDAVWGWMGQRSGTGHGSGKVGGVANTGERGTDRRRKRANRSAAARGWSVSGNRYDTLEGGLRDATAPGTREMMCGIECSTLECLTAFPGER